MARPIVLIALFLASLGLATARPGPLLASPAGAALLTALQPQGAQRPRLALPRPANQRTVRLMAWKRARGLLSALAPKQGWGRRACVDRRRRSHRRRPRPPLPAPLIPGAAKPRVPDFSFAPLPKAPALASAPPIASLTTTAWPKLAAPVFQPFQTPAFPRAMTTKTTPSTTGTQTVRQDRSGAAPAADFFAAEGPTGGAPAGPSSYWSATPWSSGKGGYNPYRRWSSGGHGDGSYHSNSGDADSSQPYADGQPAPASTEDAPPAPAGGERPSDDGLSAVLDLHNALRARHGAGPLTWSPELASGAQGWAEGCVMEHSGGDSWGENLAMGYAPTDAVQVPRGAARGVQGLNAVRVHTCARFLCARNSHGRSAGTQACHQPQTNPLLPHQTNTTPPPTRPPTGLV